MVFWGDLISLISLNGQEQQRMEIGDATDEVILSLKWLPSGFYFLRVTGNNKTSIQKIIRL